MKLFHDLNRLLNYRYTGMTSSCTLTCYNIPEGGEATIFSAEHSSGVIQSLVFRIYDSPNLTAKVSEHWERFLLTMTWDGASSAQVNNVPLAAFFNTGFGHIRESNSLLAGLNKKSCAVHGKGISIPDDRKAQWLAYIYYEMPFWNSARIVAKRTHSFGAAVICAEIRTKELKISEYKPRLTGYFSAQFNEYVYEQATHHTMFKVDDEWGHVVAVHALLGTVGYNRLQELDIIVEIDGSNAPSVSGTGFEDYFGYAHGFRGLFNTSLSMVGVPHCENKAGMTTKPWRCRVYRHMLDDAMLFTKGIFIYLEGLEDRKKERVLRKFATPTDSYSYEEERNESLAFLTMFYGRKGPGGITTDRLQYGDTYSCHVHDVVYNPQVIKRFEIRAMFENQPDIHFTKWVVSMAVGQTVKHTFKIVSKNVGVILRRTYRSFIRNQRARVWVDGQEDGTWFCHQGSQSEQFSLRLDDHYLHPRLTFNKETIVVTIQAITAWESISLEITSVIL